MTPERWQKVKEIFNSAIQYGPEERGAFLSRACSGDDALRSEVESLMASHEKTGTFIDVPAYQAAAESLVKEEAELQPGQTVGSYEVLSFISRGGMGEVYLAQDPRLGRKVALKLLPASFTKDVDRLRRFEQEARAASALNHPNIITIYEIQQAGSSHVIATEFVEGETVRQRLSYSSLTLTESLNVAIQIADALTAAHKAGIIHRDIKPENIMIRPDGYVKVLDFGLAKLTEQSSPVAAAEAPTRQVKTGSGMIMGTVGYMSPEQARGQTVDTRTDTWSLGVVIYEMVTGHAPFEGGTPSDVLSLILQREPAPLARYAPEVPIELERIIRKALHKDREERYQTVKDFLIDLKNLRRDLQFKAELERSASPNRSGDVATELTSKPTEHQPSIAVLPFTDMSAAKDQDWFCDGIAEEILNALTPLDGLRVAARTSAFSFKGKSVDLRTIGETLNVTTVLEGSVRRAGDRVRITVQLSDVANGFHLWSERYDRELKDIFDVQDDIAKAIAERLRVTLAGGKVRLVEQGTTNVEAYQLYLKGRALLGRRGASIPFALDLFRNAVAIDPGYSLAWAGIADAITGLAITGSVGAESKPQAIAAATRSIELDSASAAGHTALACASLLYENDRTKAKQEFERALELRPSYVLGRSWYAVFYLQWARGELEQGIAEARRALDGDPLSSYLSMLFACALSTAGRVDEAIETARRAVQQDPDSFIARWALGVTLGTAGRVEEAIATLETGAGMSGRHARALSSLAVVFGQWGRPSEAGALHRELMDRTARAYVPLTYLSLTAEASGQHEEAMAFARRAWDAREPPFILHARHFPEFRRLRSDPRFAAILREMDAPDGIVSATTPMAQKTPATGQMASIAVLPFANMSADRENEFFGDGLAEEIINVLAQVPGMKVAGRTSSFFFRGKDVEFGEIGRRLNVEHILEGSVRKAGNRIRVTAQLIKVADGFHLWSERYDREMTDIFAIQDEITQAIAAALRIKLSPEAATLRRHVPNLRAYESYLKARDHWYKPTPESLELFKDLLEHAIELDPKFGLAYSLLGGYYTMLANLGIRPAREVMPLARAAEEEALRVEPSLPEAHGLLGVCAGTYAYDWNEAERQWGLAMAREPVSRDVRFWYGNHYLLPIGRPVEAVEVMGRYLQDDPLNLLCRHHFAVALRHTGRLEDAEAELRKVLEIDENYALALGTLGAVCAQQGQFAEALTLTERAYALTPWANPIVGQLAALLVRTGATSRADALIEKLGPGKAYGAPTGLAVFHAVCGEFDRAGDWAVQAIEERYPALVAILGPLLRSTPRWPALAKLMNLPESIQ